jgi:hypothetical protein
MKQLGEKVLGLFVVREDDDEVPIESVEEVVPVTSAEPGPVDDLKKVMDLIASLPESVPLDMKRAIVTASLEAFGIRIDRVLASASQAERATEERARRIDQEIAKQQRMAKSVAEERARLRAVGAFFGKS